MEKYCRFGAGHRWQYGACALPAGYLGPQTHTLTTYRLILIAFPLQQRLHKRTSVLRHTYIGCLVFRVLVCGVFSSMRFHDCAAISRHCQI